jgi:YVTN family beta-propeller protein
VTPDGSKVYVSNFQSGDLSVIATATNTVIASIPIGGTPDGVAVTPDGSKVYVVNADDKPVSVLRGSDPGWQPNLCRELRQQNCVGFPPQ